MAGPPAAQPGGWPGQDQELKITLLGHREWRGQKHELKAEGDEPAESGLGWTSKPLPDFAVWPGASLSPSPHPWGFVTKCRHGTWIPLGTGSMK